MPVVEWPAAAKPALRRPAALSRPAAADPAAQVMPLTGPTVRGRGNNGQYVYLIVMPYPTPEVNPAYILRAFGLAHLPAHKCGEISLLAWFLSG